MSNERLAFWTELAAEAPELRLEPGPGWEKEVRLSRDGQIRIKMSLSQDKTSVYLVAGSPEAVAWVKQNIILLAKGLRTVAGEATGEAVQGRWFRKDNRAASVTVRSQWPEARRWLRAQHATFYRTVQSLDGM